MMYRNEDDKPGWFIFQPYPLKSCLFKLEQLKQKPCARMVEQQVVLNHLRLQMGIPSKLVSRACSAELPVLLPFLKWSDHF
jgi:hypothetical protein